MSAYVNRAFCRGVVPVGVPAFDYDRRDQLVKMLGTSEMVQVITAPSGYGKSSLCASFANSKQGFNKTVWLDCLSPCFIRDLSSHEIQRTLSQSIDDFNICVFDELPHLNVMEIETFLELVNKLAFKGTHVVINSASESKNGFLNENFKFCIKPADMLCEKGNPNSVPALVNSHSLESSIFEALKMRDLSKSEILAYYCMMILKNGTFRDLEKFCNCRHIKKDLKFLGKALPHLGIDYATREFSTANISVEDVKTGFNFAIQEIVKESKLRNRLDFFNALTDILRKHGNFKRACSVAKCNLKTPQRLKWAVMNTQCFSEACNSNQILECLNTSPQQMGDLRDEVNASICHAFYYLGNYEKAKEYASRIVRSRNALPHSKIYACSAALLSCCEEESFDFVNALLEISGSYNEEALDHPPFVLFKFDLEDIKFIDDFLITWFDNKLKAMLFLLQNVDDYNKTKGTTARRDAMCVCVSFIFRKLMAQCETINSLDVAILKAFCVTNEIDYVHELIGCLVKFSFDCLKEAQCDDDSAFEVMEAASAALKICENLCSNFLDFGNSTLFSYIKIHVARKLEDQNLARQNDLYAYEVVSVNESALQHNNDANIKISFFGGLSFSMNGNIVATNLNRRQNCLYFLYLLCRDLGKEVTRESLINTIWRGNVTTDSNRRNFYNVLNVLKKGIGDATDINIINKNSAGLFIDPNVCSTDLEDFDAFCSLINFNVDSALKDMIHVSEQIKHFSEPVLPQITKFRSFEPVRMAYKEKLIDSLIFTAMSLLERRDFKNALWFAQEAKNLDRKREDTYCIIMRAQNSLNLRSSAVNTFFECKRVLDDELGIMPSQDMQNLYRMVIS